MNTKSKSFQCRDCGAETRNVKDVFSVNGEELLFTVHRCDICQKRFNAEIAWGELGCTYKEHEIICPHCGYVYDEYDAYGFEEGEDVVACESCGKSFTLKVDVTRNYSTHRTEESMPDSFLEEVAK